MNNKEHAKNLLDTMPIVNRSASIMNAGARSRFNSPTQMGHSPAEMGHSPAEMSPLKEKNFPVKPGMKLSNFEELIDKRTGEKVGKEALNVPEGTDLSYLEGVTNLSQLASGGLRSEANISNRVNAGQYRYNREGGYSVPVDDFAKEGMTAKNNPNYPRVNLDVDKGLTFDENDEVSSFDLGRNYQKKEKKLNRAKSDLQKMIRSHNVRSSAREEEGSYPNVGLPGNRPGILETDANRPRTAANEDIYTTARLGNRSDADLRGTTHSMVGITGNPSIEKTTSYFTQRNRNMPETFTVNSLKERIAQMPNRFYATAEPGTTGFYDRKTGNIPSLSNIKDNYTHLDFTGSMQRPNDMFARNKQDQAVANNPNIRSRKDVRTSRGFNEPR